MSPCGGHSVQLNQLFTELVALDDLEFSFDLAISDNCKCGFFLQSKMKIFLSAAFSSSGFFFN
jgi:hypothetical protein